jgi:hypothetical protein
MPNKLSNYLDSIEAHLKGDSAVKANVLHEIRTHLEDKSQELKESGLSEEEAVRISTEALGPPKLIAQQVYEIHSQSTWQEAFFSALPHLLVALLFASYRWQNIICLSIILTAVTCTVIYGWCKNKPAWFFPWLGYYLLPVIITGFLLIYLPGGWAWLAIIAYLPLALFTLAYIMKQTASRDWLYVSLMLAPLPVVFSWSVALGINGFSTSNKLLARSQLATPWIVVSFLVLAVATLAFARVKQRWCKVAFLLVPPSVILFLVAVVNRGNIGFWGWMILGLSLFAVLGPAWLQTRSQQHTKNSNLLKLRS